MPTANVNIQYKNPPKEGKTNWSLKDRAGIFYSLSPALASQVEAGQTVMLRWEEKSFNGGKPMNMVQEVLGGDTAPVQQQAQGAASQAPVPPRAAPMAAQAASRPLTDQEREAKRIYCCGVVQCSMKSGKFDARDIPSLTDFAAKAWEEFLR